MIPGSPVLIILYILGMTGIAFTVLDLIGIGITTFSLLIMGIMALVVTGFWYLYTRHSRIFIIVTALLTGISAVLLVPQVYRTTVRIKIMMKYQSSLDGLNLDTVFILILILLAIFFLFSLEFVIRNHSILLTSGLVLIILVPVLGHKMDPLNLFLIIIFEAGFIVVNMSERRSGRGVMKSKHRPKINILSTVLAIAVVVMTLVPAFAIEVAGERSLFSWAYETDNFIKDTISRITNSNLGSSFSDGNVSRGNLFQTSMDQLRLTVDQRPTDTLYLKGYTGMDYRDSYWTSAFGVAPDANGAVTYSEIPAVTLIYDTYMSYNGTIPYSFYYLDLGSSDPISEMYFMIDSDTILNDNYFSTVTENGVTYLIIDTVGEQYGYLSNDRAVNFMADILNSSLEDSKFIPYGAKDSSARIKNNYYSNSSITASYTTSYLSINDLTANETLSGESVYKAALSRYKDIIKRSYTTYPKEQERLISHCKATPLSELDDITTYILVTLQNKAAYSTTPGNTPLNKDVVDYFLFDNGLGYCVHFASAAAMMYRMYGIPSRYATGFAVPSSAFSRSDHGTGKYTATINGKYAHAWVEIFLDDYGWVPVEVTPTADGTMRCHYPGYDESTMRASMDRHGWKFREHSSSNNGDAGFFGFVASSSKGVFAASFIFIIIAAVGAVIFFIIRRRVILSKLSSMSCRRLFDKIIKLLHRAGRLKEYTGSETDFAQMLANELDCMDISSASRLIRIMLEANYSDREITKEERDYVEKIYRSISAELYSKAPIIKKPIYRFIYNCPTG